MFDLNAEWTGAMQRGDYAAAWRVNDMVLAGRDRATRDDPHLPYHLRWVWDGRRFDGRHVLVRCYHGLGDSLQFARYLPVLRQRAASVTVEVQPELALLFRKVPGVDQLIFFDIDAPAPDRECSIEIMELFHALRVAPEDLPPLTLSVPVSQCQAAAIGLCWQAGLWDPERSVPPAMFAEFTGYRCATLSPVPTSLAVLNPLGCPKDILATASIIAGLDLVITVDTMVAHLAGTLNRPTWLLLKRDGDWRWMTERINSPWYRSMRIYRQHDTGNWRDVINRVKADLTLEGLSCNMS